jgi:hypothetical protein
VGALPASGLTRLVLLGLLLVAACARPGEAPGDVRTVSIVAISDWHGQLDPITLTIDGRPRRVGGAPALKAYFDQERSRKPGATLVVTAGDAFSGTPPSSRFFDDVPAVEAQNLMGIDVDTLGNHNFDTAVTSDFVFSGGDGYRMLAGRAGVTRELIAETMSQVLRQGARADARIEGRIIVEGAASGRLSAPALLSGGPSRGGP